MAAERGGADRIELCASLAEGGLTPPISLVKAVRAAVRIPVFAMIRPRVGNFVYSDAEFAEMHKSIALARELGMDGLVLGILTSDRRVDTIRTQEFVEAAQGMPVTFHRAVDEAADVLVAAEAIARTGAARILTSGGKSSALHGAGAIAKMVECTRRRLTIVAGAGVIAANAREIVQRTAVGEIHAALSTVVEPDTNPDKFEVEVRKLASALRSVEPSD